MKVMYIACNPANASDLTLEREITALQAQSLRSSGDLIQFSFFPSLHIEQLPMELARLAPDVVHFSAHGDGAHLVLANSDGASVRLSGETICAFLNSARPPQLIYFNACNSAELAQAVVPTVPAAIGTTAPITNRTARSSALAFYDRIFSGATVGEAYEVGRVMIEAMQEKSASSVIECAAGYDPSRHRLHSSPRIVAVGVPPELRFTKEGYITVKVKLVDCPPHTRQVVFFTDDKDFILDEPSDEEFDAEFLARQLCQVVRDAPRRGVVESDSVWITNEDFRIFACGTTGTGASFVVSSTIADALRDHSKYALGNQSARAEEKALFSAISRLRDRNAVDLVAIARSKKAKPITMQQKELAVSVKKSSAPGRKPSAKTSPAARMRRIKVARRK